MTEDEIRRIVRDELNRSALQIISDSAGKRARLIAGIEVFSGGEPPALPARSMASTLHPPSAETQGAAKRGAPSS